MKSYLRYEPGKRFGVISSPQSNVIYDWSGNLAITSSVQDICVWNIRQAVQIGTLKYDMVNYPYSTAGEVNSLARCPDKSMLAAGYSTGEVRIFDYLTHAVKATLRGHKSAVTVLQSDGRQVIASGGRDCDICLWDLVSMTGKCRLRGHKDAVTGIAFLPQEELSTTSKQYLVSCSKDTLLKVWDIETTTCLQTIAGHRCEIWSLALSPDAKLLVTGASDEWLRGYVVSTDTEGGGSAPSLGDDQQVLRFGGALRRDAGASDKCVAVEFSACGTVLAAVSTGKVIDLFRIRSEKEKNKRAKRKAKRAREKDRTSNNKEGEAETVAISDSSQVSELEDTLEVLPPLRASHRVRSLAFNPTANGKDGKPLRVMLSLANNQLEIYDVSGADPSVSGVPAVAPVKSAVIELHGHRSDVRAVALSADGLLLASCSSEGVKVWSTATYTCTRSCRTGYGVAVAFAPGERFVLVGTKEGRLQGVDTSTGEMTLDVEAHEGAVWSIAVRPDGRGLMSGGADKIVKFWDFTVTNAQLGLSLTREMAMSHDVLCVRFSNTKVASKLMLAVGLLDHTVKVFYDDSLKFFLSLYGHKLPVTCLDISGDSTLLASGSADKTVKLWGLDFGDCHRSLLGHEDTVTSLRWQPQTHLLFSASKDGVIKYWDADRFEQILHLPGHSGPVWAIDVSFDSAICCSGGADRSLRVWVRGEDMVFVSEEKERFLEAQAEMSLETQTGAGLDNAENGAVGTLTARSSDSIKGAERLIDVLESADLATADNKSGAEALRKALRAVASSDLESSLIELPLHLVSVLLRSLSLLSRSGLDAELCARCAVFLLRLHGSQIQVSGSMRTDLDKLQAALRSTLGDSRRLLGTNVAALKLMARFAADRQQDRIGLEKAVDVGTSNKPSVERGGTKKKKQRIK